MLRKGIMMKEQMKNQNEYRENGNLYVKKIKWCACAKKIGELYEVDCRIHQRGYHSYLYQKDQGWISKWYSKRKLWLAEEAKNTVDEAARRFEKQAADVKTGGSRRVSIADAELDVYYCPANAKTDKANHDERSSFGSTFDFLLEFREQGTGQKISEFYGCVSIGEMLHRLAFHYRIRDCKSKELIRDATKENIDRNPFIIAARETGDSMLEKRIKVSYGLADLEECITVAKETGSRILPPLPEEYDQNYAVDADTITEQPLALLLRSGYAIVHRPNFGMRGSTRRKWTLNPHTMSVVDAAEIDAPSMSFSDFLELFGDDEQKEF